MAVKNAAQAPAKTVADPCAAYETLLPLWTRSRAACSGERFVKDLDGLIDTLTFTNLLIPFSPSMTQAQYNFYKAEAEWPGISALFSKLLVGALLRKQPQLTLPDSVPAGAKDWILNEFGVDNTPLSAFLDMALKEEVETSNAWVFVDYPNIKDPESLSKEDLAAYKPYPVLHSAESIINVKLSPDASGKSTLSRVIVKGRTASFTENEFHPTYVDTVWVHELVNNMYQVRIFKAQAPSNVVPVISGKTQIKNDKKAFELDRVVPVLVNDEPLSYIPAWPLNGDTGYTEPTLSPIIDKEISLYNKMSRRNHLLYGASTYTPIIMSDMSDESFKDIVDAGLGSWIKLGVDDKADVLKTPTEALADMEKAIAANIEEMARLGIRMLSPETDQSGVALELRNASQTAQLGSLNTKVSNTLRQVIVFMINWRYELELTVADVEFSMSSDFHPTPLGVEWLRLATEWYEAGKIPRSVWIALIKVNDMLEPDYDDKEGVKEINADPLVLPPMDPNMTNSFVNNGGQQ